MRLCNPCVPDPNIAPPQAQTQDSVPTSSGHSRSQSTANQPPSQTPLYSRLSAYMGAHSQTLEQAARSRSVTMVSPASPQVRSRRIARTNLHPEQPISPSTRPNINLRTPPPNPPQPRPRLRPTLPGPDRRHLPRPPLGLRPDPHQPRPPARPPAPAGPAADSRRRRMPRLPPRAPLPPPPELRGRARGAHHRVHHVAQQHAHPGRRRARPVGDALVQLAAETHGHVSVQGDGEGLRGLGGVYYLSGGV